MALSVQSLSQPYGATQQYLVTGTVGDTITATLDSSATQNIALISPIAAKMTASGVVFSATRTVATGGAQTLTFTDTTDGESFAVTLNMSGDPVVTPNPIVGQVGNTITVTVSETNDPDAFATLSIDDTTTANISSSSNAEGLATLSVSLLKNGSTNLQVDDGHGGTLTVQILVGAASPAQNVKINSGEAVIGGVVVQIPATLVALQDTTTGYNGSGRYTISLTQSGSFVVTYGIPPAESSTQINLASATFTTQGKVFLADLRTLQVTVQAVNSTIMATPDADGSYLAPGVVTERTLGADVLAMFGTVPSGTSEPSNPHEGQLFFNTTTNVLEVYDSGQWVVISEVGASSTLAGLSDVKITSAINGQVLTWNATDSKWENQALPSDADTLAGDSDVLISAPTDGQVLVYSAGKWTNSTASTLNTTAYMPLVNGDIPGPGIMADPNGQCIAVPL